jgi:hypothetical protein
LDEGGLLLEEPETPLWEDDLAEDGPPAVDAVDLPLGETIGIIDEVRDMLDNYPVCLVILTICVAILAYSLHEFL